MKWRQVSSRLWKKLLVIVAITSVHIVTNNVNVDSSMSLNTSMNAAAVPQVQQDLQELDQMSVSERDLLNVNALIDRRVCKTAVSGDKKFVDDVTFIVDPAKRIGYCHVPKVASSSW